MCLPVNACLGLFLRLKLLALDLSSHTRLLTLDSPSLFLSPCFRCSLISSHKAHIREEITPAFPAVGILHHAAQRFEQSVRSARETTVGQRIKRSNMPGIEEGLPKKRSATNKMRRREGKETEASLNQRPRTPTDNKGSTSLVNMKLCEINDVKRMHTNSRSKRPAPNNGKRVCSNT